MPEEFTKALRFGLVEDFSVGGNRRKEMSRDAHQAVEARVRAIIAKHLQGSAAHAIELASDTPILGKGLGLDSLEALVLVTKIEAEFGIEIDDEDLKVELFKSVGALAEHVEAKLARNNSHGRLD
jgi:acyl carrier protein